MIKKPNVYKAFLFGIAISGLACWLSIAGHFRWLNLKWHDLILSWQISVPASDATLLINNDLSPEQSLGEPLASLLNKIKAYEPRSVVLFGMPYYHDKSLEAVSDPIFSVIKGQSANPPVTTIADFSLQAVDGVYRQFSTEGAGRLIQLYGLEQNSEPDSYQFNFFTDVHSIANLPLSQALQGGLIAPLVKGKVVFISLDSKVQQHRYFTPVGYVNYTQLQVLAADTLKTQSALRSLPAIATVILLLSVYALYFFVLQLLSPRGSILFTLSMTGLSVVLGVTVLAFGHILLPLVEVLLLQLGSVIYLLAVERLRDESVVLRISAELNARLSKKVQPPSFYQTENPWDNLHTLINQHLNLHRSIFLAKVPKDHRVVEIHALNCSLDDIKEMRRDYQRAPYSEAIAVHRPLKLQRQYFTQLDESEWQYICPLMVSSEVLGFWALTIKPGQNFNQSVFENNLMHFSREITELLFHRQSYQQKNQQENRLLRRVLGMKLAQSEYLALNTSVTLLERRLSSLQYVFDGLSTASALYNLFGQILHANQQLDKLVQRWQLPVYSLTAHDFLLKLTGLDSEVVKQRLLQVTLHSAEANFKLSIEQQHSYYVLRVTAVKVDDNPSEQGFMVQGLLFEFVDISEAQKVISMKKELYSQYFHQMRNNISTLNLIARRLSKQLPDDQQQFIKMLEQSLEDCTKLNVSIEDQLAMQRQQSSTVVPLNPASVVKNVLTGEKDSLTLKRIEVDLDAPSIMSLVLAEPEQLASMVQRIVDILIDDSDSNGTLLNIVIKDVAPRDGQRYVLITLINKGYGVPQEHIDKLLLVLKEAPLELNCDGEKLEQLLLLVHQSSHWGLTVEVSSTLGEGYCFRLRAPVFMVQ